MPLFGPPNVEKLKAKGKVKVLIYRALRDPRVYEATVAALVEIGSPAVDLLIAALEEPVEPIRTGAAEALGRIGDARAMKPLIAALKDGDKAVRHTAAEALITISAPAVEPLIVALKARDRDVRQATAEALVKMGAPAVSPLITVLKARDRAVRQAAAEILVKIGAPAVGPLITVLKDRDRDVRQAAAETLVKIGAPAVGPLIAAFKDQDANARQAAAEALVKIGVPAVGPLIAALKHWNKDVRQAAAQALENLGWQPGSDENGAWYWIAKRNWDQCIKIGTPAVGPLIAVLKERDKDVHQAATQALENLGWQPGSDENGAWYWIAKRNWDQCIKIGALAVGPLIAVLKGRDKDVRQAAAQALGQIGDAQAVGPLITTLKGRDKDVRQAAARALGRIGDAQAVGSLIATLKGGDKDVRQAAARALENLGWQPGSDENGAWYWIAKRNWDQCIKIGAPAVEPLIAVLKERDKDVRQAATQALGRIGDARAVVPLIIALKHWDTDVRQATAEALVKIGAPAVGPLVAALKGGDKDVRQAAVQALGWIGDARAVRPLITALKHGDTDVGRAAAEALGRIGDARAVGPLVAALKHWYVRQAAAEALVRIGTPAIEPLIAALKEGDKDVRQAAAQALENLGWQPGSDENGAWYWIAKRNWHQCIKIGTPAVGPLIAVLKEGDKDVRQAATQALENLGWQPGSDENGAWYWIAKRNWDQCIKIGALAVGPLIAVLKERDKDVRRAAAGTLVSMYRAGQLDKAHKQLILAQRDTIQHHSDHTVRYHSDEITCSGSHNDESPGHADTGIGIDFPL